MKRFILTLVCCVIFTAPAWADDATVINDPAEAQKLLGRHLFNENILSEYQQLPNHVFGEANVTEKDGLYSLNAQQICYQRDWHKPYRVFGGKVEIMGVISKINQNSFIVNGHINASSSAVFRGSFPDPMRLDCNVNGIFKFLRKGHITYWRMQNQNNSCLKFLDAINIFSAPLHGNPPEERCGHSMKEIEDKAPEDFFR